MRFVLLVVMPTTHVTSGMETVRVVLVSLVTSAKMSAHVAFMDTVVHNIALAPMMNCVIT